MKIIYFIVLVLYWLFAIRIAQTVMQKTENPDERKSENLPPTWAVIVSRRSAAWQLIP
ncbi:MAG: hypothetical protein KGM99_14385 [Burkholderiales bacterium]|nr:hypothetical protein [Burkholderiales bacterium]